MMSVNSSQFWIPSLFLFPRENDSSMRIGAIAERLLKSRSGQGAAFLGLHKRSGNEAVLPRTDVGSSRRHTPGLTDFGNCSSDTRSWSRATKPLSVLLQQLSAGARWLLFTDKSLKSALFEHLIRFYPNGFSVILFLPSLLYKSVRP